MHKVCNHFFLGNIVPLKIEQPYQKKIDMRSQNKFFQKKVILVHILWIKVFLAIIITVLQIFLHDASTAQSIRQTFIKLFY